LKEIIANFTDKKTPQLLQYVLGFFPFLSYSDHVPEEDPFQLYMRPGFKNEQSKSTEYFYKGKFRQKQLFSKKSKLHIKLDIQHNS